jgi:hypothetical protein
MRVFPRPAFSLSLAAGDRRVAGNRKPVRRKRGRHKRGLRSRPPLRSSSSLAFGAFWRAPSRSMELEAGARTHQALTRPNQTLGTGEEVGGMGPCVWLLPCTPPSPPCVSPGCDDKNGVTGHVGRSGYKNGLTGHAGQDCVGEATVPGGLGNHEQRDGGGQWRPLWAGRKPRWEGRGHEARQATVRPTVGTPPCSSMVARPFWNGACRVEAAAGRSLPNMP